jgi:hypothetical protein
MSFELTGTICHIGETQQVSDRFKKREFVLQTTEEINGNNYTNYAKFQTVQNKCDLLDSYQLGQEVTVSFNIKGNRWDRDGQANYITSLDAWRIEATGAKPAQPTYGTGNSTTNQNNYNPSPEDDGMPF